MALVRLGWAIAALVASLSAATVSEARTRVVALSDCPRAANGCIEMVMHWDYARTDRAPVAGKRDGAGGKSFRVLTIRGKLDKGQARAFELAVASSGSPRSDDLGEVAYLGRSREGRPVIMTDQGALALETRGLHVGRADGVVIIDERAQKIVRSYLGGLDGGAYVVAGPDAVAAKARSGLCLSPPESRPGALSAASHCADGSTPADGLRFSERVGGAVKPAPNVDLALVRKLLPQTHDLSDMELRARVGRVGDHHLVVTPWAN